MLIILFDDKNSIFTVYIKLFGFLLSKLWIDQQELYIVIGGVTQNYSQCMPNHDSYSVNYCSNKKYFSRGSTDFFEIGQIS